MTTTAARSKANGRSRPQAARLMHPLIEPLAAEAAKPPKRPAVKAPDGPPAELYPSFDLPLGAFWKALDGFSGWTDSHLPHLSAAERHDPQDCEPVAPRLDPCLCPACGAELEESGPSFRCPREQRDVTNAEWYGLSLDPDPVPDGEPDDEPVPVATPAEAVA